MSAGLLAQDRLRAPAFLLTTPIQDWEEECKLVLAGWAAVEAAKPHSVHRHDDLGLVVLRLEAPLHYYCAFSHAIGADTVLTALPGQRFEVESRWVGG